VAQSAQTLTLISKPLAFEMNKVQIESLNGLLWFADLQERRSDEYF